MSCSFFLFWFTLMSSISNYACNAYTATKIKQVIPELFIKKVDIILENWNPNLFNSNENHSRLRWHETQTIIIVQLLWPYMNNSY